MAEFYHSVTLNEEKCVGCTNCIKRCPTEAIRVRGGKAVIASERCIDCGECIRICPHHAKRARHSHLSQLSDFTYTIALPAPSLYGQFNNLDDIDYVLTGLKEMGFDDVFEVSRAAELVSEATRKLMDAGALKRPVISSACPAVVRLIRVRFPDLCDHVLPLKSPMETAAAMAKRDAVKKTGLPPQQIGCFFLTPCPAKVTDIEMPLGIEKSQVDGAIAISEVFPELSHKMDHLEKVEPLANSGVIGVGWSTSGGEAAALSTRSTWPPMALRTSSGCWRKSRTSASATWTLSSSTPVPAGAWVGCSAWRTPTWPRPASSGCGNTCPCPRTT